MRAIHREREDIEAVVVAGDVMELLGLNALRHIDFRIKNPLLIAHRFADRHAVRSQHDRNTARCIVQYRRHPGIALCDCIARGLIEKRRSDDVEHLAFKRMRAGPDPDRRFEVVSTCLPRRARRPDGRIGRDVHLLSLGN